MTNNNILQTALKALSVLRLVSEAGAPISMSEVAEQADLSRTAAFRMLKTLEVAGFVQVVQGGKRYEATVNHAGAASFNDALSLLRRISVANPVSGLDEAQLHENTKLSRPQIRAVLDDLHRHRLVDACGAGQWRISPGILGYAQQLLRASPTLAALRPIMQTLSDETGETITFFRESEGFQFVTEVVPCKQPLSYSLPIGSNHSVLRGAAGRAWLCGHDDVEVPQIVHRLMALGTHEPAVGPEALIRDAIRFRKLGYAYCHNERIENAAATAVPITGPTGRIAGVLSVMAPVFRLTEEQGQLLGPRMVALTRDLFGSNTCISGENSEKQLPE
ncbi:IclR family transcriptional regulator domain-containing protein [Roseinatronobacter alkalisoli]|uniref:Helix-turn-helix domain-containing protein n=1 Tax=Roseinatronobacter alkalisoli TaxID=3028235 RepID=A0ABT5TEI6_9RHOB|nr:helix-turn-helix domain-containing protein [Roseinatronobacter sp. HJB301]MDD7973525.1 helix-turn-helix domain-containing protein [Roseinatronobacter sp. HJB301]